MKKLQFLHNLLSIWGGVFCIVLLSCNNFLEGSDFKEQLEKDIAYANAPFHEIRVECDEGTGSILTETILSKKVTDKFNIEFKISSGYQFAGWKAFSKSSDGILTELSSEIINFSPYNMEASDGLYKVTATFAGAASGIVIKPRCLLLPKIAEIAPALESSGCDQDSLISIAFNKAVDTESFFNEEGKVSCVSISSDGEILEEYFDTPYFSDDKKTLYFTPLCIADSNKLLLDIYDSRSFRDITVSLAFNGEKDSDGIALTENREHRYRINKNFGNQKKVALNISNDTSTGSFLEQGKVECTVGFYVEVQYTVNKEDYHFAGLEAVSSTDGSSRAEAVSFTLISENKDDGIYKYRIRVTEEANDILIRAVCTRIPKVLDIFPPDSQSGYNQDTVIKITFSKAVAKETLTDFSFVSVYTDGGVSLESKYGEPYFSDGDTVLNIPPAKNTPIFEEASSETLKNVTIAIDLSAVNDIDGLLFQPCEPYTFRLNKNRDAIKPIFLSARMFSDRDEQSKFYQELTDKSFEQWSKEARAGFSNGDYSQNHLANKVYMRLEGSDADSGLDKVRIRETHLQDTIGNITNVAQKPCDITLNELSAGLYDVDYTLESSDGLVKLELNLVDGAGNESLETKTFYVIKDVAIVFSSLSFKEFAAKSLSTAYHIDCVREGYFKTPGANYATGYSNATTQPYNFPANLGLFDSTGENKFVSPWENCPKADDGDYLFTLTLSDGSKDNFFSGCSSDYNCELYYGYAEDFQLDDSHKAEKSGSRFTLKINSDQIVFIRITVSDEAGNSSVVKRIIPPKTNFEKSGSWYKSDKNIKSNYTFNTKLRVFGEDVLSSYGNYITMYYHERTNNPEDHYYTTNMLFNTAGTSGMLKYYKVYPVSAFVYGDFAEKDVTNIYVLRDQDFSGEIWLSPLNEKLYYTIGCYWDSQYGYQYYHNSKYVDERGLKTQTSGLEDFVSEDTISLAVEPIHNSGVCKVTASGFKKEGADTSAVYYLKFRNTETNVYSVATTDFTYLASPANYELYIEVITSDSKDFSRTNPFEFYRIDSGVKSDVKITSLELDQDLTSPIFPDTKYTFGKYTQTSELDSLFIANLPNGYRQPLKYFKPDSGSFYSHYLYKYYSDRDGNNSGLPYDDENGSGMYEAASGLGQVDYYFIPYASDSTRDCMDISLENLEKLYSKYKKTIVYDLNGSDYFIPYDGLDEGLYTICQVAKDKNENSAVKCSRAFNRMLGKPLKIKLVEQAGKYSSDPSIIYVDFYTEDESGNECKLDMSGINSGVCWCFNQETNTWEIPNEEYAPDEKFFVFPYTYADSMDNQDSYSREHFMYYGKKYKDLSKGDGRLRAFSYPSESKYTWQKICIVYDDGTSASSGFYDVLYTYMEYYYRSFLDKNPIVCKLKNLVAGVTGDVIYADAPFMAHTLYCGKKLTQGTSSKDAQVWLNKGCETGVYIEDGSEKVYSYDSNYADSVPSGKYYTTIVHFADGSFVMSDIRYKN